MIPRYCMAWLMLCFTSAALYAQNGKIIEKTNFAIPDSVTKYVQERNPGLAAKLASVNFYRIRYLSDGLKVTAYAAEPKQKGDYPCIISNRGGNRDFSQWNPRSIVIYLGRMASWGYLVVASQYRGNDGGEGKEEFGGNDVNDVLNLVPVLSQFTNADTSRIGIEGTSRGGMMTYLALKQSCRFKAAAVTAGMADAFINISKRPEMEKDVFSQLVPNYWNEKEEQLKKRSAVFWADKICKTTPLLIMHGSADWRVPPAEVLELINKLYAYKHPFRFQFFEGSDHSITEFREERFNELKRHFDYYLRDGHKLPNMEPHGL